MNAWWTCLRLFLTCISLVWTPIGVQADTLHTVPAGKMPNRHAERWSAPRIRLYGPKQHAPERNYQAIVCVTRNAVYSAPLHHVWVCGTRTTLHGYSICVIYAVFLTLQGDCFNFYVPRLFGVQLLACNLVLSEGSASCSPGRAVVTW